MDPVLQAALAPVLRDIERTGAPMPLVTAGYSDEPELPFRYADLTRAPGGGSSAGNDTSEPEAARIVSATDGVQDWLIHYLWNQVQQPTNWPVCPRHPVNHPLRPEVSDGAAVWQCPMDGVVISPIGSLPGGS